MVETSDFTIALIALAPFLAAILAPAVFRFTGHYAGFVLAIIPAAIFIYLTGYVPAIAHGELILTQMEWVPAAAVADLGVYLPSIQFSFFLDGLSLIFGLLISGIGAIILIYSSDYLKGHKHQGRFFAFILLFMGSMLGLVLADNMIVLFVFWELTTITSFLLIGFDHTRQAARRAAIQALIVTNAGGLMLLAGIVVLHVLTAQASDGPGTWSLADIRGGYGFVRESALYVPILILFLGGAFTKSAQFPFHFWLPNAMEAPTPVSAFLHSATMVKGGVYLLARMSPTLGGDYLWNIILVIVGGTTLLFGALNAFAQTDYKQMMAQTTIASLGLLVLLIGAGTEVSIIAAVIYLVAHAFYKAGLFLGVGILDHGTGTRKVADLGGLAAKMPIALLVIGLAALSMAGLPPAIGFFAKEEMYAAFVSSNFADLLVLVVLIAGNALMVGAAVLIVAKVFFGPLKPTPLPPHDGSPTLYVGPVLLGLLAIGAGIWAAWTGETFISAAASTIYNFRIDAHPAWDFGIFAHPEFYLSILTWAAGVAIYWKYDELRDGLWRFRDRLNWNFDVAFDGFMVSLIRGADLITRFWHHGKLEYYLLVIFFLFGFSLFVPLVVADALPHWVSWPDLTYFEWGVIAIAAIGLVIVMAARTRLVAIVSLGIQGFAVAIIYMLMGAPDLSFTQFMVETLSVVILALVMTRLDLEQHDPRYLESRLRDSGLAAFCGISVTLMLLSVLQYPLDLRLTDLFAATSVAIAHGHNIVNVILVDYRGLDTLGEISVVMAAGIAILALIRIRAGGPRGGAGAPKNGGALTGTLARSGRGT